MALLSFYVKCGRAHGPSGAGRFHSGLFARRRRSAPSWPCRALLLAVAVLRTVRHVLRIGQDVRSILRRPAAQTPAAMGLLHRRWRDLPPPQPCPPTTTRTAATARATARFPARSLARSPARAPEEAGIEASGNRRLPASQELQPDESGFVEVIEVEQEEMVLEGTPVVPQSVVAGRPIEIADEEVVLEGTPLVPLGPSLWYVHETQRRGSVHTHGQLYVPYSRMPRSFLTVHDPLDWPEVD
jgi:hypothetical protein